jgi:glycosyltransferase involved in cell wall biosynthesis
MNITFPVLTMTRPMGGAIPPYETANAMRRRGHSVHVIHVGLNDQVTSLADLSWIEFEDGIEHVFPGAFPGPDGSLPAKPTEIALTAGDNRLAGLAAYLPEADFIAGYDDLLPSKHGLPFVFVQGYRPHSHAIEDLVYQYPCPKVCVSKWLYDLGTAKGVPAEELVHRPNGVKHDKYRLVSPIETRSLVVSTTYHDHPQKGADDSLAVLTEVRRHVPEMEAIILSQVPPRHEIAPWMTVVTDPPQEFIVNEIYNRTRVFLCASHYEGFGFPSAEAMACGAALVTTANGGSADYAFHRATALVNARGDVRGLASSVLRLLRIDEQRIRLARNGMEFVRTHLDWDAGAKKLETFLTEYAAQSDRYARR